MRATALIFGLIVGLLGCGDDDGGGGLDGGLRDAGPDGSRPVLPEVDAGDGGDLIRGEGLEGDLCDRDGDCVDGLSCVDSRFTVGVCARGCTNSAGCEDGESCFSYTDEANGHCINNVVEEFGVCGVGDTSRCSDVLGLNCLYYSGSAIGLCVRYCELADSVDGGTDDAGVASCTTGQVCTDNVATDASGEPAGVCGFWEERGDPCEVAAGRFCRGTDICAPQDPSDSDSPTRCYQVCTGNVTVCDDGTTCTPSASGRFAYCL